MDYAENSKMMEEEEVKEYLFPQNDYRLVKFNTFNTEQQLNSISSTPYINLFEQDDDEKSKNDVNRSAYEHDEDEDLDDALSDIDEDDENLDELNFDDDMD